MYIYGSRRRYSLRTVPPTISSKLPVVHSSYSICVLGQLTRNSFSVARVNAV